MNADAQKVRSIFLAAVEKHAPDQWEAYLEAACAGDPELQRRVEVLLRAHAQPSSLLDSPAPALFDTVDEPVREGPGTVVGPYKLLEQIGEGGMGLVFVAEQQQPVRRKVALKVIKKPFQNPALAGRSPWDSRTYVKSSGVLKRLLSRVWTRARSSPASRPSARPWP